MHLTGLDFLLWVPGPLGECALLLVLWRKHRARHFPIFTILIASYICRTIALLFTLHYGSKQAYFNVYWSLAIIDVGLQLAVFFEIATHVFRPTGSWATDIRDSLLWLLGASVALASALTWMDAPATRTLRQAIVLKGNFFSSVLISELFVGMVALSVTSGLPFRTHVARIAQGWGAYAILGMLTEGFQNYFGLASGDVAYTWLSRFQIACFAACLVYWIVALAQEAPEPRALPDQLNRQLLFLHHRAGATLRFLQPRRRA